MEYVTLNTGSKRPILGFGVFQIPDAQECESSVIEAAPGPEPAEEVQPAADSDAKEDSAALAPAPAPRKRARKKPHRPAKE